MIKSYSIGSITIFIIQSRLAFIALFRNGHIAASPKYLEYYMYDKCRNSFCDEFCSKHTETRHYSLHCNSNSGSPEIFRGYTIPQLSYLLPTLSFTGSPCAITSPVNRDSLTIYPAGNRSHAYVH